MGPFSRYKTVLAEFCWNLRTCFYRESNVLCLKWRRSFKEYSTVLVIDCIVKINYKLIMTILYINFVVKTVVHKLYIVQVVHNHIHVRLLQAWLQILLKNVLMLSVRM